MGNPFSKGKKDSEELVPLDHVTQAECNELRGTWEPDSEKCLVRISEQEPDGSYKVTPLQLRKTRPSRPAVE